MCFTVLKVEKDYGARRNLYLWYVPFGILFWSTLAVQWGSDG